MRDNGMLLIAVVSIVVIKKLIPFPPFSLKLVKNNFIYYKFKIFYLINN